jgi:hypothetical protein
VTALGGTVRAENDRGAVFTIELPHRVEAPRAAEATP